VPLAVGEEVFPPMSPLGLMSVKGVGKLYIDLAHVAAEASESFFLQVT
jgi:hypothetical protein